MKNILLITIISLSIFTMSCQEDFSYETERYSATQENLVGNFHLQNIDFKFKSDSTFTFDNGFETLSGTWFFLSDVTKPGEQKNLIITWSDNFPMSGSKYNAYYMMGNLYLEYQNDVILTPMFFMDHHNPMKSDKNQNYSNLERYY